MIINPKNKVRRLNEEEKNIVMKVKPKVTLNDMPWDVIDLIFKTLPKYPEYPILRGLNK